MEGRRAASLVAVGTAGVGLGFGLGYLVFRKPPTAVKAASDPALPASTATPALLPSTAATPTNGPKVPAVAPGAPAGVAVPPQAPNSLLAFLSLNPGILGGGNQGVTGGLDTAGLPSPPPLPTAAPVDPTAPVGSANNPRKSSTGGLF